MAGTHREQDDVVADAGQCARPDELQAGEVLFCDIVAPPQLPFPCDERPARPFKAEEPGDAAARLAEQRACLAKPETPEAVGADCTHEQAHRTIQASKRGRTQCLSRCRC